MSRFAIFFLQYEAGFPEWLRIAHPGSARTHYAYPVYEIFARRRVPEDTLLL